MEDISARGPVMNTPLLQTAISREQNEQDGQSAINDLLDAESFSQFVESVAQESSSLFALLALLGIRHVIARTRRFISSRLLIKSVAESSAVQVQLAMILSATNANHVIIMRLHNGDHFQNGESMLKFSATEEVTASGVRGLTHSLQGQPIGSFTKLIDLVEQGPAWQNVSQVDGFLRDTLDANNLKTLYCQKLPLSDEMAVLICTFENEIPPELQQELPSRVRSELANLRLLYAQPKTTFWNVVSALSHLKK